MKNIQVFISFAVFLLLTNAQEYVDITSASTKSPIYKNCTTEPEESSTSYSWMTPDSINATSGYQIAIQNSDIVGFYNCTVNDANVNSYMAVNLSTPIIEHVGRSITLYKGQTNQKLICHSWSSPVPMFYWYYKKTDANRTSINDLTTTTTYSIETNGQTSTLTIKSLPKKENVEYTCKATNVANPDGVETTVLVRVKDNLDAVWPFLGIVVEAAVLALIMVIYEKHKKARQAKKQGSEQASNSQAAN